jgi:hypothetical protein
MRLDKDDWTIAQDILVPDWFAIGYFNIGILKASNTGHCSKILRLFRCLFEWRFEKKMNYMIKCSVFLHEENDMIDISQ